LKYNFLLFLSDSTEIGANFSTSGEDANKNSLSGGMNGTKSLEISSSAIGSKISQLSLSNIAQGLEEGAKTSANYTYKYTIDQLPQYSSNAANNLSVNQIPGANVSYQAWSNIRTNSGDHFDEWNKNQENGGKYLGPVANRMRRMPIRTYKLISPSDQNYTVSENVTENLSSNQSFTDRLSNYFSNNSTNDEQITKEQIAIANLLASFINKSKFGDVFKAKVKESYKSNLKSALESFLEQIKAKELNEQIMKRDQKQLQQETTTKTTVTARLRTKITISTTQTPSTSTTTKRIELNPLQALLSSVLNANLGPVSLSYIAKHLVRLPILNELLAKNRPLDFVNPYVATEKPVETMF